MMMPPLRYFVVDAFTNRPFAGNPAAVVPLSEWRDDGWLQNVAMEMNLSETAFLVKEDDGYRLRWFTPKVEVALCGHATLASAHVLWSEGYASPAEEIRFQTKSGLLKATRKESWIELDFPVKPPTESSAAARVAGGVGDFSQVRRSKPVRLSGRGGIGGRGSPAGPRLRSALQPGITGRDRHQQIRHTAVRLRFPLLRPSGWVSTKIR